MLSLFGSLRPRIGNPVHNEMKSAELCGAAVAADGNVITGRAAGAAFDFALKLIKVLRGQEAADKVARSVVYQ